MTSTADRHQLYERARETWDDTTARYLVDSLPIDPNELATKSDLTALTAATKADLAVFSADLRREISDRFSEQTRFLVLTMAGMSLTSITFTIGAVLLR